MKTSVAPQPRTRLYVGNLSYDVTETHLRSLFSEVGAVLMVALAHDRETGLPRGFAYVEISCSDDGQRAIQVLGGRVLLGRPLRVSEAPLRAAIGGAWASPALLPDDPPVHG